MYRNCCYDSKTKECILYTWDELGNRVTTRHAHYPYYYVETLNDSKFDATSIFGTHLKKRIFANQYERSKSLKDSPVKRLFYNLGCEHQFLIDHFHKTPEFKDSQQFSKNPLKIFYLDIETPCAVGFPDPDLAEHPIDLITIYDSISETFYTWGLKHEYVPEKSNVVYKSFKDEKSLLRSFIKFWISDYPDIVTAWNLPFDMKYIINRIKLLFNDTAHEILSPVEKIYEKEKLNKFKQMTKYYVIKGVTCLDYLDVYRKFNTTEKASYKLGDIAEEELGETKIEYDGSLYDLSKNDPITYIKYNIQDVELIKKLNDNLQYLELVRMLAYMGLCQFEDALGTIKNVDGAIAIEALKTDRIIPTFQTEGTGVRFEGAYVKDPEKGLHEHIVSYDLNSLYPSILITLNASPETKIGKITSRDSEKVCLTLVTGKDYELTNEKFEQFVKSKNIAVSSAGVLFDQATRGIVPFILDAMYKQRVDTRKILKDKKKELQKFDKNSKEYAELEVLCKQLNIKQYTIKIFLNSAYGYLGNEYASMYDIDLARSVTLTGQECIKNSEKIMENFEYNGKKIFEKQIKYCDTDSLYLSYTQLLTQFPEVKFWEVEGKKIDKNMYKLVDETVENYLNDGIKKWGETVLNSKDCRFQFKRESICDVALWLQKKRYILNVMDLEGIPKDNEIKVTGYDTQSSAVPKKVKPFLKDMLRVILRDKTVTAANKKYKEIYESFKSLELNEISYPRSLKDLNKYASQCKGFQVIKGMPIHCKSAHYYNVLVDHFKFSEKYDYIRNGDKIRFFYVQKNSYGIETLAYKDEKYPKEFLKTFQIDHKKMFDKIIEKSILRLYDALGWTLDNGSIDSVVNIKDFLS